jgi:hypothetical protein
MAPGPTKTLLDHVKAEPGGFFRQVRSHHVNDMRARLRVSFQVRSHTLSAYPSADARGVPSIHRCPPTCDGDPARYPRMTHDMVAENYREQQQSRDRRVVSDVQRKVSLGKPRHGHTDPACSGTDAAATSTDE